MTAKLFHKKGSGTGPYITPSDERGEVTAKQKPPDAQGPVPMAPFPTPVSVTRRAPQRLEAAAAKAAARDRTRPLFWDVHRVDTVL